MLIDVVHSLPPHGGRVDQTNEINEVQSWRLWLLVCAAVRQYQHRAVLDTPLSETQRPSSLPITILPL